MGVLHVNRNRGTQFSNARRFGEWEDGGQRTTSRLADLPPSDLADFCDWEACVRTNGYNHICWWSDAGHERCRVCHGSADCNGFPVSQADCIAHARDPRRARCHVGLLEECEIQEALLGPGNTAATHTCALSDQACAGSLEGDLSSQALVAQQETRQVTVEELGVEIGVAQRLRTDGGFQCTHSDFDAGTGLYETWGLYSTCQADLDDGGDAAASDAADKPSDAALVEAGE